LAQGQGSIDELRRQLEAAQAQALALQTEARQQDKTLEQLEQQVTQQQACIDALEARLAASAATQQASSEQGR